MRILSDISQERDTMSVVTSLTGVLERITSLRIAQIRNQVLASQQFFAALWQIYSQIRVGKLFHLGHGRGVKVIKKELLILITSEGGLSGDIDRRLINQALQYYRPAKHDIVVVGSRAAAQLSELRVAFVKSFKMPVKETHINVAPLVELVQRYDSAMVFYQAYASLSSLSVKQIQLNAAVAEMGKNVKPGDDLITEASYIFEPSTFAVIDHLERSMLQIALSQVVLDSKLTQYASRFTAMHEAHDRAEESLSDLNFLFARAQRRLKDERLKEVINGLRKSGL